MEVMKMNDITAVCVIVDDLYKGLFVVSFLAEMPCSSTQFRCPSGLKNNPRLRCLDRSAICNGVANCMRGEDEANCTRRNCSSYQYVYILNKSTYIQQILFI
jgi:hypothetical protein